MGAMHTKVFSYPEYVYYSCGSQQLNTGNFMSPAPPPSLTHAHRESLNSFLKKKDGYEICISHTEKKRRYTK